MRKSTVQTKQDAAGSYEIEVFDAPNPKGILVCSHGNGVRRWDGEKFFYQLAEQYSEYVCMLVDQNQVLEDGCKLNDLSIMVERVQSLIALAKQSYPNVPVIVVGHSMGCGVASHLKLDDVDKVIFVAPAAGNATNKLIERFGPEVANGMMTKSSDGLSKLISKEYFSSVDGIVWEDEYRKMLARYPEVYVFASGAEEIVGEERLAHRDMGFKQYTVILDATHNYSGEASKKLFAQMDKLV